MTIWLKALYIVHTFVMSDIHNFLFGILAFEWLWGNRDLKKCHKFFDPPKQPYIPKSKKMGNSQIIRYYIRYGSLLWMSAQFRGEIEGTLGIGSFFKSVIGSKWWTYQHCLMSSAIECVEHRKHDYNEFAQNLSNSKWRLPPEVLQITTT